GMSHKATSGIALAAVMWLSVAASLHAQIVRSESPLTYYRDVAPILQGHCIECHRPGDIAPMSLRTYEEVKSYTALIRQKVVAREMPPWHADPRFGEFANERRLSQQDIDKIVAWIDQGANPGDPGQPQPVLAERRGIGGPDVVFQMPEPYSLDGKAMD